MAKTTHTEIVRRAYGNKVLTGPVQRQPSRLMHNI